jgi:hypothetical protein
MTKTTDLKKAIDEKATFLVELEFLVANNAPESMLKVKRTAIAELETVLQDNEAVVKCDALTTALETVKTSVERIVKETGSGFPLNIRFRFDKGTLEKFTVTAAVSSGAGSGGTRSSGTLTYNGKKFPKEVHCNYSAKKEFSAAVVQLDSKAVFKSYKAAAESVLSTIYPSLWKLYMGKADGEKYHSASAHDLLKRMVKVEIDEYFTREGNVNGPTAK